MAKLTLTNELCSLENTSQSPLNSPQDVSIVVEEAEHWEHQLTKEKFSAVEVAISDLHERELKYLRTYCLEQYNNRNTGVTATIPKDPAKKLKRNSSIKTGKRSLEKENKLLSGGIFEVPLHVVLQIDTINSTRQLATAASRCTRDQLRRNVAPLALKGNPKFSAGFSRGYGGSLKAKSASPVNLAPQFQPQSVDDSDFLKVPSATRDSKSFSTPSTPLEKRKDRSSRVSSDLSNNINPAISLTDLVKKLDNVNSGSTGSFNSLYDDKEDNLKLPVILKSCCEFILLRGLDTEGIFRVSGAKKEIRTLRAEFNATSNMQLSPSTHIHTVTCLLKEFLKDLPEALLTRTLYYPFLHTLKIGCPEERLEAYGELVSLLPKSNRDTLKYLLWFLNIVAENSQDRHDSDGLPIDGNKMDYSNLAVVIGPNILHNHKQGNSDSNTQLAIEAEETPLAVEVVKGLMQNHKPLFIVKSELRKKILSLMYEVKQHHFDEVLNGYSKIEEDYKAQQSEFSSDSARQSRNDLGSLHLTNGRSAILSESHTSTTTSAESLSDYGNSPDYDKLFCDRQHSTPDLSTLTLENVLERRLSRSLENSDGLLLSGEDSSPSTSRKKSIYDLTPPSSPKTERAANQKNVFSRTRSTKLIKAPRPASYYGKLTPKQTFAQFRLDKFAAECDVNSDSLQSQTLDTAYYLQADRSVSDEQPDVQSLPETNSIGKNTSDEKRESEV